MSFKPSYSLDNVFWTTLPGHYRYGGENKSIVDTNIEFQTDSGVEFIYQQYRKRHFELHFLIGETDLAAFRALHDAVGGSTAFWFRLNLISEGFSPTTYYVLKETEFAPQEEEPAEDNHGVEPFYSYVLRLRERLV